MMARVKPQRAACQQTGNGKIKRTFKQSVRPTPRVLCSPAIDSGLYRRTRKNLVPEIAWVNEPSLSPVLVQLAGPRLVVDSSVPPFTHVIVTLFPDWETLVICGGAAAAPSVMRTLSMARISFHQVVATRNSTMRS